MLFDFYGLGDFINIYDFRDKKRNTTNYIVYMLNRVMKMFEYSGLPETIPKKYIELYTMVNGHSVVIEHNDNLYVCFGGFSGVPNEYYLPTQYVVANPYLDLFKTYTIGEDCVLVSNDTMMMGLMPMFSRYASTLVENDLSLNIACINSRIAALIDARDDSTKTSAEKYIADIVDGKNGIIASNAFFDGIRVQPYGEHEHRMSDLIEFQQYTKASWFNELGLNANYNMKRESIMSDESQLNDDMLSPLIDDMLECRKNAVNEINNMFGTNISVDYGSTWRDNKEEMELMRDMMEVSINDGGEDIDEPNETNESGLPTDDDG